MRNFNFPVAISLLFFLAALTFGPIHAQEVAEVESLYYVYLQDKDTASPEFVAAFHPDAIARRAKAGIPFPAYDDLPLRERDVRRVAGIVDSVRYQLRWSGALTVRATEAQVRELEKLECVRAVEAMGGWMPQVAAAIPEEPAQDTAKLHKLYDNVRKLMRLDTLQSVGLTGKGVRIAVFDAGFSGAEAHPAFAHLRSANRIELTNDFYGGKGENVYYGSGHGTGVLGSIGGMSEYGATGAATGASYILARTEHNNKEKAIEEDHWLAAAEWADMHGAHIISSSLGYAKKRYEPSQMDGKTAPVSRAAATAVRKGILVVNSAGNEGMGKFRVIAAPADADSVLTVGATYPMIRYVMPFSSIGPNARGVLKPEIAAPGYVVTASRTGGLTTMPGTSFSCPLVAGVAACMFERHPGKTNMEIRDMIVQAGHWYPYYDYTLGNGALDARFLLREREAIAATFATSITADSIIILVEPAKLAAATKGNTNGSPLSIAFQAPDGKLMAYVNRRLMAGETRTAMALPRIKGLRLRIWWEGYLFEQDI